MHQTLLSLLIHSSDSNSGYKMLLKSVHHQKNLDWASDENPFCRNAAHEPLTRHNCLFRADAAPFRDAERSDMVIGFGE